MIVRARVVNVALAILVAGCASTPSTVELTPEEQYEPELVTVPPVTPLVEYPPIEPVEPPLPPPATPATTAAPPPPTTPPVTPPPAEPLREPPAEAAAGVTGAPAEPSEDQQLIALLADLQRYGGMTVDEQRRELANATAALGRQRTDANRIRLAVLYTLIRATPQDDLRALQLFDNVARSNPGPTPFKQLAAVLQAQVTERQKAVRDEQQKADAAINKLEALRQMERSLLRDRVRSGGGGGGGGGAGGSGH